MPQPPAPGRRTSHFALVMVVCLLVACALAALLAAYGVDQHLDSLTLPVAGRTLNQFMAVLLTCIALIVPLTANLYTPKLVTLYVRHPLIVAMLSVLLLSHILCLALNFVPPGGRLNHVLVRTVTLIYLLVMLGALPFLYGISRFLRPSFFIPMLTRKGVHSLHALARGERPVSAAHDLFENVDVVTNLALTGMNRGDRQVVLLSLRALNGFLAEIIGCGALPGSTWRAQGPYFVPGLAREGQDYLIREQVWPEAYVLAQMLKAMESATRRQHELLAELAHQLVDTARLAARHHADTVVELHIMTFNTLMREVIEDRDLRRFQNLSYYYRMLMEALQPYPGPMHETARHLVHYARIAHKLGMYFALETVIYDLGEAVLSLARRDQDSAVQVVQTWAGPLWQDSIQQGGHLKTAAWRVLIRVHWEARALGLETLRECLYWRYLSDETIHREQIELVLDENRELHYEFNDRLMRFAFLPPEAERLARAFAEG